MAGARFLVGGLLLMAACTLRSWIELPAGPASGPAFVAAGLAAGGLRVAGGPRAATSLRRSPSSSSSASAFSGSAVARSAAGAAAEASAAPFFPEDWIEEAPIRIGHGFDIHRMGAKGDPEVQGPVIVGGVTFEDFHLGIVAHSDGDVVYHSVVDAIFGALTLPDIGSFFPDYDPRWKGAASDVFMAEAWRQMDARGYRIGNVDVTIIAQAPRMIVKDHPLAEPGKPFDYKAEMVDNVAALLGCPKSRVNVKARTHENVDAVGKKEAISCHVVVVLEKKP